MVSSSVCCGALSVFSSNHLFPHDLVFGMHRMLDCLVDSPPLRPITHEWVKYRGACSPTAQRVQLSFDESETRLLHQNTSQIRSASRSFARLVFEHEYFRLALSTLHLSDSSFGPTWTYLTECSAGLITGATNCLQDHPWVRPSCSERG